MYRSPSCTLCHLVLVLDTKPVSTQSISLWSLLEERSVNKKDRHEHRPTQNCIVTDRTASTCSHKVGPFDLSKA